MRVDDWLKLAFVVSWGVCFLLFFMKQQVLSQFFWIASQVPLLVLALFTFEREDGKEIEYPVLKYIKMVFLLEFSIFILCNFLNIPTEITYGILVLTRIMGLNLCFSDT